MLSPGAGRRCRRAPNECPSADGVTRSSFFESASMASTSPPLSPAALSRRDLLGAGVVAALFLVFFGEAFLRLIDLWNSDPNYSHGYLIPFLSGWLAWRSWRQVGPPVQGEVRLGAMA